MTIQRQKIQIDVEATTEGAVRGMDRVADATDRARRAVEKDDAAIKKASLEYQVARARAMNLAEAQDKLAARTNEVARAIDRAASMQAKYNALNATSGSSLGAMAAGAGKAAGAIGLAGVAAFGAVTMVSDLAKESLELQNMFDALPFSLNAARQATRGLADDTTLARNAIMANQAGVATSAQAYAELVGMAQTLALKMGRDVNDTVERVTMGIAKQEREILDELVILPRMEEMWRQHAETLGKTTAKLTDHEKTAAFTRSAIDALRQATQGVEVDMDGAAASIARATVEVKNLRTAALGGVEAQTSLADGVAQLDAKLLRQIGDLGTYRSTYYEIADALENAGVNTEKYRNNAAGLEEDIRKVLDAEAKRLVAMADDRALTQDLVDEAQRLLDVKGVLSDVDRRLIERDLERLGVARAATEAEAAAAAEAAAQRDARIVEIEEQLAFGRAAQSSQEQINALVAEEAELRAQVLEAEGKQAEAAELRRKAQLDALAAMGEASRPKRGGGRRRREGLERWEQEELERAAEQHREMLATRQRQRIEDARLGESLNPFSRANLERDLSNVIDFEQRRADVVLAARLRDIEAQRAAGVDPVQLAEQEIEARLQALAVQERSAAARFDREIVIAEAQGEQQRVRELTAEREVALLELQDQAEALHHEAAMTRLAERKAAEEEVHARRVAIAEESAELVLGAAEAVVQGSVIEGRAIKAQIAATAKAEAMRHGLILGPSELIRAAISAAGGNIPGAIAHGRNAAKSFAFAAAMAAVAGGAGAFGGSARGSSDRGFGADAFGGGEQAGGAMGREEQAGRGTTSDRSWDIGGGVPLSMRAQRDVSAMAAMTTSAGQVVVHNSTTLHLVGQPDDATMLALEKAQVRTAQRVGRLAVGGRR